MKETIQNELILTNPIMRERILQTKLAYLKVARVIQPHMLSQSSQDSSTASSWSQVPKVLESAINEWKFIGLLQRSKRRKWSNIRDCIQRCNIQFNTYKIMCIEVNIEMLIWSNPTQHDDRRSARWTTRGYRCSILQENARVFTTMISTLSCRVWKKVQC